MSELLGPFAVEASGPALVLLRLAAALLLGAVVAQVYRRSRGEPSSSFTRTLVLLAILIAMVTQVIGDNVARAFSLVGALSIVRFRTVVRDTQDTAYVIFAVAVGMAVGAHNLWVAVAGIGVVTVAAFAMRNGPETPDVPLPFRLSVRVGLGHDVRVLLGPTLDAFVATRRIAEVSTTRQGMAIETIYRTALRDESAAHELVAALNRIDGVQSATLQLVDADQE